MLAYQAWISAFVVSCLCCHLLVSRARTAWMDNPVERSMHVVPVPRLGGVGVAAGAVAGALWVWPESPSMSWLATVLAVVLLWIVALMDDLRSLGAGQRLLVQLLAAVLAVVIAGAYPEQLLPGWQGLCLAVLGVLWGINLFNFMDGIDGLAGSMGAIGFSTLAALAYMQGNADYAVWCGLLAASTAGFLCLNWSPARLFMGDSGSTVLGFAMVIASFQGVRQALFPVWVPLLLFAPFWVDASVTLLKRLLKGEKVWQAHRQHYYQRWALAGHGHVKVTLAYVALMLGGAFTALAWQLAGARYNWLVPCAGWLVVYVVLLAMPVRENRS